VSFAAPVWLNVLWGLPLLAWLLWRDARKRKGQIAQVFGETLGERVAPASLWRKRSWKWTLWVLGVAALLLAAAGPRWGFQWKETKSRGVELVVALDVSRSMDAQDVDPSRLERARREVQDLLQLAQGDRVGLVIFAGGAYPRVPLTRDRKALLQILRTMDSQVLQSQGSSLASALAVARDLFGDEAASHRGIVLISDGEAWDSNLDRSDLKSEVALLAEQGIRVYAVGVGTEQGGPIPEAGGGFKKDRTGKVVLTRLDASALKVIAAATGGAYVQSVAGASDMRALADTLHSALDSVEGEAHRERVWDERFQWPLALGVVLLLGAALMGDGRSLVVACLLLGVAAPARAESSVDAATLWTEGLALHQAGQFEEAHRVFTDLADRALDPATALSARYNAGNASYRGGRLEDALAEWNRILEQVPDHPQAASNVEQVQQELQARRQPPEEQPQDGEDGDPQEGEDGESQEGQQQENGAEGEQEEPSELEDLSQLDDTEEAPPEGEDGEVSPVAPVEGELTEEEAMRLLELIEEGRPRVVVGGRSQEKDW
jgi:Ca-activated chloride channel family protein